MRFFGLGLGHIINILTTGKPEGLPYLRLNVSAPNIDTIQRTIALIIIGPLIYVAGQTFTTNDSYNGYTLFSPEFSRFTYLIDNNGTIVHTWKSHHIQGLGVYLLENGDLLRTALGPESTFFSGITSSVERFDWNGTRLWTFTYGDDQHHLHHDIKPLPNGNILMIALENKTRDEAINAGKNPNQPTDTWTNIYSGFIMEIKPNGTKRGDIVWEWHAWDHLIQDYDSTKTNYGAIADHPELLDINYHTPEMGTHTIDLHHINSINYNPDLDQILISSRHYNELWIIDHSTTTQQAQGHTGGRYNHGGDLLYRWGNPHAYDTGDPTNQQFFCPHDARWIPPDCPGHGDILVFNNGNNRPPTPYTSIDELTPPLTANGSYYRTPGTAYGPHNLTWTYTTDTYQEFLGGAQRLPNGNTLICLGSSARFIEVAPDTTIVWRYDNIFPYPLTTKKNLTCFPFNLLIYTTDVFKINRYPPDYPGLHNLSLLRAI